MAVYTRRMQSSLLPPPPQKKKNRLRLFCKNTRKPLGRQITNVTVGRWKTLLKEFVISLAAGKESTNVAAVMFTDAAALRSTRRGRCNVLSHKWQNAQSWSSNLADERRVSEKLNCRDLTPDGPTRSSPSATAIWASPDLVADRRTPHQKRLVTRGPQYNIS